MCDQKELLEGEETESSYFYELSEQTAVDAKTYGAKMICAKNPEDLSIMGNYNT